eukprot:gene48375-1749_t
MTLPLSRVNFTFAPRKRPMMPVIVGGQHEGGLTREGFEREYGTALGAEMWADAVWHSSLRRPATDTRVGADGRAYTRQQFRNRVAGKNARLLAMDGKVLTRVNDVPVSRFADVEEPEVELHFESPVPRRPLHWADVEPAAPELRRVDFNEKYGGPTAGKTAWDGAPESPPGRAGKQQRRSKQQEATDGPITLF